MVEPPDETNFTPISPNPYIVGNPVRDRSMFFGREAEFDLVRKRFQHDNRGGLFVFCGERRSGKTSILFQILDQRLGPEFIPVLVDMQSMAVANEVDFLGKLSDEIIYAMQPSVTDLPAPPQFTSDSSHSATFAAFVERVLIAGSRGTSTPKKLILLFDEYELFENKIDSGTLDRDVLYVLSSLMEHLPVFLVFTGSQHLEQRRREYWQILGKSLFKQISYLEREDALNLIRNPVKNRVRYSEGTVDVIYRLSAGQPFYTQAICQNLVDHLNEHHTDTVTLEIIATVIDGMINNPLPQMIFLWDGLSRDEKLVLALLAETLSDPREHVTAAHLVRTIGTREYPLEIGKAQIATALEKLFKSEMLLRDDSSPPPAYAFRMDLWRLWVRRMHSVWQVMREEGMPIRQGIITRRKWIRRAAIGGGIGVVGAIAVLGFSVFGRGGKDGSGPVASVSSGQFVLDVEPKDAVIYQDGRRMGLGTFRDSIIAHHDHVFRIVAAGYADSQLVVQVDSGDSASRHVRLRPLVGGLRIETQPTGATVRVDGRERGRSPIVVSDLAVAIPHQVEATLAGYGATQQTFAVSANQVVPVSLPLPLGKTDVMLTTDPPGAEIRVDGAPRGRSPIVLSLTLGLHSVGLSRDGFSAAETSFVVHENTRQFDLTLQRDPPGLLVVLGDRPAEIYLDGTLVMEHVQNSGPRELLHGIHAVHVVLVSGEVIDTTVRIRPRERAVFDYSKRTVTWTPLEGH